MKSIIKEIIVILLLIIVILLTLGILFYDDIATQKKIPNKVAEYTLPQEMVKELEETVKKAETQNIVKTYTVDSYDLERDIRTHAYETGKTNPFARISTNNNGGNTNSSTNNTNSISQNNSQGSFLNEVK